jgi:hypothetical protein
MNLEHNHPMDSTLDEYTKLSPAVLEIIRTFAVMTQSPSISGIVEFLHLRFPGSNFSKEEVESRRKSFKNEVAPIKVPQTVQLLGLLVKETFSLADQTQWYYETRYDDANHLTGLFWMSPNQRDLYQRYHDVVVNDTTAKTNRLGMQLNCFVVVDAMFKTRLVACALTRQETEQDYNWILTQLKTASSNITPEVIMVDEDPSMDAACPDVFPQTRIVNCIWHIERNIAKHLSHTFGSARYASFTTHFNRLMHALTPAKFDEQWATLLRDFCERKTVGSDGKGDTVYTGTVAEYLEKLYKRRYHWAGPWVKASFTAGMRSTQRVEGNHHLIKLMGANSKTTLPALFRMIGMKSDKELFKVLEKEKRRGRRLNYDIVNRNFSHVVKMNETFLALYASNEMKSEMASSFGLSHTIVMLHHVLHEWNDGDISTSNTVRWHHVFM